MRLPLSAALDSVLFAREHLRFLPDAAQAELLRSASPRLILNCTRQWGKSTVVSILAAHHLGIAEAGSLIVIVSPSQRQSAETLRKVSDFCRRAGLAVSRDGSNRFSLALDNGSRAVALPGKETTIRGFSAPSLLIVDEAAMVSDAVYRAVRPMLAAAPKARMVLLSTPRGRHGFFHSEWTSNRPWHRVTVPATECPRISKDFLDEERASLGDFAFRQEYLCEFTDTREQIFSHELLSNVLTDDYSPWRV